MNNISRAVRKMLYTPPSGKKEKKKVAERIKYCQAYGETGTPSYTLFRGV